MHLIPSADEEQIIDSAANFLGKSLPRQRLHAASQGRFTPDIRQAVAKLGWLGMTLDEESGGFGFSVVDETLLFREVGRVLGPVGLLGNCLGVRIAAHAGNLDLVGKLVAGELAVALTRNDPNRAEVRLFDHIDADMAITIQGDRAALLTLAGTPIVSLPCLDKSVTMGQANLSGASVLAEAPVAEIETAGRLLVAAMLVGMCEAMTDMIAGYARIRETFGRPIGAYQAVRHPIADMAVRTFAARCQLFLAAVSLRDLTADAALQVDAAKVLANEAALLNADANMQLHGGISTTDEHDCHLFLKRAHLLTELFGRLVPLERMLVTSLNPA